MTRTYVIPVCPVCRRQASGCELVCFCAELVEGLEPVEVETVALDDPRIIVGPALQNTPVRVS